MKIRLRRGRYYKADEAETLSMMPLPKLTMLLLNLDMLFETKVKSVAGEKKNVLTVQHTPQTSWDVLVPSFSSEYPTYYDKKYGETLSFRSILNN